MPTWQRRFSKALARSFKTAGPVIVFPSSGTGAWEAAIVNTLSPGDKVLMVETGHFATLWRQMAARWGIEVDFMPGDWRHGADPAAIEARLAQDTSHAIKAVMVVHNETSTGVTSRVGAIRAAMDKVGHPALLLVDTISSLGSVDYWHDEWKVDVTVSCSQKKLQPSMNLFCEQLTVTSSLPFVVPVIDRAERGDGVDQQQRGWPPGDRGADGTDAAGDPGGGLVVHHHHRLDRMREVSCARRASIAADRRRRSRRA